MTNDGSTLRRTPLYDVHARLGGRFVAFGGWEMPVRYGSILSEARAVRSSVGLFDVSHMGRLNVSGADAAALLSATLSVDVTGLRLGRARYNVICDDDGGIIDDCIVYRRGSSRFLLIPNASNTDAVIARLAELAERMGADANVVNVTERIAMIACQGPNAEAALQRLTERDLSKVRPFRAVRATVVGSEGLIARTGYTGEDGFEAMIPSEDAARLWMTLMEIGAAACGLAARDVLRLEAGLMLHGNDIDQSVNPYEAGLGRFVEPDRDGYPAGPALRRIRDEGVSRKIVGFKMVGRGIPRAGHDILDGERRIGRVTSGGPSPTLDSNIGMGYVPIAYSAVGTRIAIDARGRKVEAEVVDLPFYGGGATAAVALEPVFFEGFDSSSN